MKKETMDVSNISQNSTEIKIQLPYLSYYYDEKDKKVQAKQLQQQENRILKTKVVRLTPQLSCRCSKTLKSHINNKQTAIEIIFLHLFLSDIDGYNDPIKSKINIPN